MILYRDAKYLKHECAKLNIKVSIVTVNGQIALNIMRGQFFDFSSAQRFIQCYQIEQGARWAAYRPKVKEDQESVAEVAS